MTGAARVRKSSSRQILAGHLNIWTGSAEKKHRFTQQARKRNMVGSLLSKSSSHGPKGLVCYERVAAETSKGSQERVSMTING